MCGKIGFTDVVGVFVAGLALVCGARAGASVSLLECSGLQRAYDPKTDVRLPATALTRLFKLDEDRRLLSEYVNNAWTVFDARSRIDPFGISARYSRDYPDGRVDVIFELNRFNEQLVYILDVDERPGEFFIGQCKTNVSSDDGDHR